MVSSNSESGITVTYQDADGTLDFSVASQTDQNFTNADHTKLNSIETSADVTDTTNVVAALTAGSNVSIASDGTISATDTNTNTTYSAGSGLSLSSTTFSHSDTSSQGSVNNSSGTVIQDITLDTYGHITSLGSTNLDSRYYTETEAANHFKSLVVQGNFMNTYSWSGDTVGSANNGWSDFGSTAPFSGTGSYGQNGTDAENSRAVETLPNGAKGVVWQTPSNDSASGADGGWNCTINGVDSTKAYRSVIYFRRTDDSTSGTFYHGCAGSHTLNTDGTTNTNPYFKSQSYSSFVQDRWYVSIGYIQPYQASGTTNSVRGGIYDCTTGKKVFASTDFMMKNGSTSQQHRTYLYYSTDTSTSIDFYGPRFEEVNGNEPSTQELVNKGIDGLAAMSFHSKYDPEALSQLTESSDANDDKFLLWDESASEWKYMRLDDLQDSIDNNTTYSVGDGGLTQKNFTTTLKSKLDGIEASADVTDTTNVVAALTAGSNVSITSGGTISATNTNTQLSNEQVQDIVGAMVSSNSESGITVTYQDADGTLDFSVASQTDQNFTNADHTKLNSIETSADVTDTTNVVAALTAGSNVSIASNGTISATNTNTQLSNEQVQDIVGAMVSSNSESGITVTYQDADGTLDFSVASQTDQNFTNADHTKLNGIETGADVTDTTNVVAALTAGSNVSIASNGTISSTNTNTTYSAGTGISLSGTTFSLTDTASKLSLSGGTLTGTLTARDVKIGSDYHLQRSNHHSGHLEGSYNNVGANGSKSNPIYTIGSSYNPTDAALSNMYGIGYSHTDASFISMTGASGWGMYVAADGDARVFLGGSNGVISSTGEHYVGSSRVFHDTYHPNADTLTTARTIALGGDVTGSASFNGGSNITISASLASGSVGASEIAANAVGSSEIATNAVTSAKIAADAVGASEIAANAVGASELNVSGNGSTSQFLRSDGDGTFTWATPTDTNTNTTYSAGRGLDLSGTEFQLETDLRDSISYIGYDSNDYIQWSNNSSVRAVVAGTQRLIVGTSGIDVTGNATADTFRTDTNNVNYNLFTRNHSSSTLYVQAAQSNSIQGIASFRYGSTAAAQGTEVCAIRRNSSYFINTKLGVGTNNPSSTLDVSGTVKSSGDVEVTSSSAGVILKAPNGYKWRVTVNNSGMITTTNVS
jgi:ABC-type sugar transport system ATPase subunit